MSSCFRLYICSRLVGYSSTTTSCWVRMAVCARELSSYLGWHTFTIWTDWCCFDSTSSRVDNSKSLFLSIVFSFERRVFSGTCCLVTLLSGIPLLLAGLCSLSTRCWNSLTGSRKFIYFTGEGFDGVLSAFIRNVWIFNGFCLECSFDLLTGDTDTFCFFSAEKVGWRIVLGLLLFIVS